MPERDDGTFVPYAEFVARRHRRLRISAELRSQASAQTIEGEVLHVHTREAAADDQGESPAVSTPIEGCGTQPHEEPQCEVLRSMRLIRGSDS